MSTSAATKQQQAEADPDEAVVGPSDDESEDVHVPAAEDEDEDEAEDEDESEADPDAFPDAASEGASVERQRLLLEREATRHYKALAKLMPDFEQVFAECPLCETFGYVPSPPVMVDERRETCPECNGHGGVISGSHVEAHRIEQCGRCNGNGWVTKVAPVLPAPPTAFNLPPVAAGVGNGEDPRAAELRALGYVVTPTTPPAPVA